VLLTDQLRARHVFAGPAPCFVAVRPGCTLLRRFPRDFPQCVLCSMLCFVLREIEGRIGCDALSERGSTQKFVVFRVSAYDRCTWYHRFEDGFARFLRISCVARAGTTYVGEGEKVGCRSRSEQRQDSRREGMRCLVPYERERMANNRQRGGGAVCLADTEGSRQVRTPARCTLVVGRCTHLGWRVINVLRLSGNC